jgi:hypothetical protein
VTGIERETAVEGAGMMNQAGLGRRAGSEAEAAVVKGVMLALTAEQKTAGMLPSPASMTMKIAHQHGIGMTASTERGRARIGGGILMIMQMTDMTSMKALCKV